ncbi:RNA polymerase sigma factor [Emticicia sp. TH156]|uniref:RNA polymerase sigma factor n=1 Tax=Emticicia sp. TH156 TaxID=2067454 RepID=UPI000C761318|nr:sigma-70 family RNA polymerase sigma factor [Emticicia sp. TH156]PLK43144.1 RNA polymerase subunit sigma-70 [Emticicia sp. TH156]
MNLNVTIQHCKAGNRKAQKTIFDLFSKTFLRLSFRYLNDRQYAEDACLEAFALIFESLKAFDYQSDAQTEAWMKRIVVNQSLKILRRNKNFLFQSLSDEDPLESTNIGIEDDMSGREILELISSLPDGYRAVFNLYVIEGYTHTEIASALNITEGTSRSQLFKAKMMLKKNIEMKKVI